MLLGTKAMLNAKRTIAHSQDEAAEIETKGRVLAVAEAKRINSIYSERPALNRSESEMTGGSLSLSKRHWR